MILTFLGEGSFRLQSGNISLLIDPASNKLKADTVLRTSSSSAISQGENLIWEGEFSFPGEYETKGIEIIGFPVEAKEGTAQKTSFLVKWEDVSFGILTQLTKLPDAATIEKINEPDVLLLRADKGFLSEELAEKTIRQIEPKIAVLACESPKEMSKILGEKNEPQEKLVFRKKDLDAVAEGSIVILKKT